jgi:hypothetical protein
MLMIFDRRHIELRPEKREGIGFSPLQAIVHEIVDWMNAKVGLSQIGRSITGTERTDRAILDLHTHSPIVIALLKGLVSFQKGEIASVHECSELRPGELGRVMSNQLRFCRRALPQWNRFCGSGRHEYL